MRFTRKKHYTFSPLIVVCSIFVIVFIVAWIQKPHAPPVQTTTNMSKPKLLSPTPSPKPKNINFDQAFDIALIGYGGGNHDGTYLTDSIIVAHIDPKLAKIFLISIPRDTWIQIPTSTQTVAYKKINASYVVGMDDTAFPNKPSEFQNPNGGGKLVEYVTSQVTGLPVNHFVGIDFRGFTKAIDALEGIDIKVEKEFTDPEYPIDGKESDTCGYSKDEIPTLDFQLLTAPAYEVYPCRYQTLHFTAGIHHMDGATALSYVRSRHSPEDGSDFGRSNRQKALLSAVKQKVLTLSFIPKLIPLSTQLSETFKTDILLGDIHKGITNALAYNSYKVVSIALTEDNILTHTTSRDGQYILVPRSGTDNWADIHTWIADQLK